MSLAKQPQLVSVAMITYNHERYVRQAIESIINQKTIYRIELIIGEDCSSDETLAICKEYEQKCPQIVKLLPSNVNLGVTSNLIRTLQACTGEYIALCEGDDYWGDSLKVQKQVDFLSANRDFVASYHQMRVVDEYGNVIRDSKNSFLHNHDLTPEEMISGRVMSLASLCFRNVISSYPEEFSKSPTGDNFLSSLLGTYGKGKYQNEIEPSSYRMHTGGVWSLKNNAHKKMTLLFSYFLMWQYYARIGKPEWAKLLYNKIMLEGFYSNPYQDRSVGWLGTTEIHLVRQIRRVFRLLRKLASSPPKVPK